MLFRDCLIDVLAMLPSEDARRQVLNCLTARENMLRAHQGMLLAYLYEVGYPSGDAADRWWNQHADLFRIVEDPDEAARLVVNWAERVNVTLELSRGEPPLCELKRQYRAVANLIGGRGDHRFGEAYEKTRDGASGVERLSSAGTWLQRLPPWRGRGAESTLAP